MFLRSNPPRKATVFVRLRNIVLEVLSPFHIVKHFRHCFRIFTNSDYVKMIVKLALEPNYSSLKTLHGLLLLLTCLITLNIYDLLHFEHKNDVTIIIKLHKTTHLWLVALYKSLIMIVTLFLCSKCNRSYVFME